MSDILKVAKYLKTCNQILLVDIPKTGCNYIHQGKKLFVGINVENHEGFTPLIIDGKIDMVNTNANFYQRDDSNRIWLKVTNRKNQSVDLPVYTKDSDSVKTPKHMKLIKCDLTGDKNTRVVLPIVWAWKCSDKTCVPVEHYKDCDKIYGSWQECNESANKIMALNTNYYLALSAIILLALSLLIMVFTTMFATDLKKNTGNFFIKLSVIFLISPVILLSVIAYRITDAKI